MSVGHVYPAVLGRRERLLTGVGLALALGVPCFVALGIAREAPGPLPLAIPLVFVAILWVTSRFRPLGYRVGTSAIVVERPWWPVSIPFADVVALETPARLPGLTLGLMRSDFFGTYGVFWNRTWGRFTAHVSDATNLVVLVRRARGRIVLSPSDRDGFVATVSAATGVPAPE